jgi:hypothetical protein
LRANLDDFRPVLHNLISVAARADSRKRTETIMTKDELQALNAELLSLLANLRDQIENTLEELGITADGEDECPDDDSD